LFSESLGRAACPALALQRLPCLSRRIDWSGLRHFGESEHIRCVVDELHDAVLFCSSALPRSHGQANSAACFVINACTVIGAVPVNSSMKELVPAKMPSW